MIREGARPRSRLEIAASSVTVPDEVRAAWTGVAPELAAGQIWRARWDDQVQLVVILDADQRPTAMPLSFDVDYTDSATTRIEAAANPFNIPVIAWPRLAQALPIVVFDRFAGQLPPQATDSLPSEPARSGEDRQLPHPVRVYRALLEDAMEELSAASWHEGGSGDLSAILQRANLRIQDVAAALGATPQRALAVWRGQLALTHEEAEKVAPLLGESAESLLTANPAPPTDLVACLEQPVRHRQVLAYAALRSVKVPAAYRDLAYQTWALAARQTGQKATNWNLRLDTLFAAVLDEQ